MHCKVDRQRNSGARRSLLHYTIHCGLLATRREVENAVWKDFIYKIPNIKNEVVWRLPSPKWKIHNCVSISGSPMLLPSHPYWLNPLVCFLYNEELHNLYFSQSVIRMIKSRRMRWAGYVARMGEKMNVCRILVGNPEGKRPLGRIRRMW
jgi:hypothetical protein